MKSFHLSKIEFLFPLILSIFFFLTKEGDLSSFVYVIIALALSFYFFPIRTFSKIPVLHSKKSQKRFFIIASFILSISIVVSILSLYIEPISDSFIKVSIYILGFINLFFLFYFHFKEFPRSIFWTHFCFLFFFSFLT